MVFVDFSKAFDTGGRTGLWQLLRKYGCPEKFTTMMAALHTGKLEDKYRNRSVLQMGSSKVVYWPPRSSPPSYQQCKTRRSVDLLNVAHFRAMTKTSRILMRELLLTDDSALVAHSAEDMQKIVDAFSDASKKFHLKINIKKTEVLYQPYSTRIREEDIVVDGNKLNSVPEFTYLSHH